MLSTTRANVSVGPPYDAGLYRNGSLDIDLVRIDAHSPYLAELEHAWAERMVETIHELPPIPPELLPE
jgi:putative proteasome-type protease